MNLEECNNRKFYMLGWKFKVIWDFRLLKKATTGSQLLFYEPLGNGICSHKINTTAVLSTNLWKGSYLITRKNPCLVSHRGRKLPSSYVECCATNLIGYCILHNCHREAGSAVVLTLLYNGCIPWEQLDGYGLVRPFLSLWKVWLRDCNKALL